MKRSPYIVGVLVFIALLAQIFLAVDRRRAESDRSSASDQQPSQVQHLSTTPPDPVSAPAPSITTCSQVMDLANLPFNQGQVALGKVGGSLVGSCFRAIYPNYGNGYLHSSDHYAALQILLEREPTFREVYDSYHLSGSRNIDAARVKEGGGGRPSGWATMNPEARRYAVLVHRYGISAGSKILDGKLKDPRPEETEALLREWSGGTTPAPTPAPVPTPAPTPTPSPSPAPTPPPTSRFSGTLTLTENGITRRFELVETPPPPK